MPNINLEDILFNAHQESFRMRHYYLGVEHLLVALLEIKGSLTGTIIEEYGLNREYVINKIRLKIGKGSKHRQWAGTPKTPRADRILKQAETTAKAKNREVVNERDVLVAILEDYDSIPVQVLRALGQNIESLIVDVQNYANILSPTRPYVRIEYAEDFDKDFSPSDEHLYILRRMFNGYENLRIERRLTGGYTRSLLLVVTPIHVDTRQDASLVVKIGNTDSILDEAQRYETHVKNTLPSFAARLEDKPVAPDNARMAGVKYTLIAAPDAQPRDLRAIINEWSAQQLGIWLRDSLYAVFGNIWWQQSRPYRFIAWREYDFLLPPILTLDMVPESDIPPDAKTLRFPFRRAEVADVELGETIVIENFTVRKIDRDNDLIKLAIGLNTAPEMAYEVEIRGVNLQENTYYRGEVVDHIAGQVWQTRRDQLMDAVRALVPDFELSQEMIPGSYDRSRNVPNPLLNYERLLDSMVNGRISKIHGDMHLGNIMIGMNNGAYLIDFGRAREGHTVFDWVSLEISILSDVVMPVIGDSWDDARFILDYLRRVNMDEALPKGHDDLVQAMAPVIEVRRIAQQCLSNPNNWFEYYVSLAFCGLRATTWSSMSPSSRRLMFLISGLAFESLRSMLGHGFSKGNPPAPDETDLNTTI